MAFERLEDIFKNQYDINQGDVDFGVRFFTGDGNGNPDTELETLRTDFDALPQGGAVGLKTSTLSDGFWVAPENTFDTPILDVGNEPNFSSGDTPIAVKHIGLIDLEGNYSKTQDVPWFAFATLTSAIDVTDGAFIRVDANQTPPETRFRVGDPNVYTSEQDAPALATYRPLLAASWMMKAGLTDSSANGGTGSANTYEHLLVEAEINTPNATNPQENTSYNLPLANNAINIDASTGVVTIDPGVFQIDLSKTGTQDDYEEHPVTRVSLHLSPDDGNGNPSETPANGNMIARDDSPNQNASIPGYVEITSYDIDFRQP